MPQTVDHRLHSTYADPHKTQPRRRLSVPSWRIPAGFAHTEAAVSPAAIRHLRKLNRRHHRQHHPKQHVAHPADMSDSLTHTRIHTHSPQLSIVVGCAKPDSDQHGQPRCRHPYVSGKADRNSGLTAPTGTACPPAHTCTAHPHTAHTTVIRPPGRPRWPEWPTLGGPGRDVHSHRADRQREEHLVVEDHQLPHLAAHHHVVVRLHVADAAHQRLRPREAAEAVVHGAVAVDSPGHTFRTHMSVRARTDAQLRSAGPSAELRDTVDTQDPTGRSPPAFHVKRRSSRVGAWRPSTSPWRQHRSRRR